MFKQSPIARTLLHLANLLVIAFLLLPLFALAIGSIQSERSLQADTRALFPREVTLDNFLVILSKGEQKGRIFEQVTYLPENIKQFYRALLNSTIIAISVTALTRRSTTYISLKSGSCTVITGSWSALNAPFGCGGNFE